MKIPAFVAKPILSCFLFLLACFLFLLIAPNLSKPSYAASCNVNTTIGITPGFTINVGTFGIDYSQPTGLTLVKDSDGSQIKLGSLQSPDGAHDYQLPANIPLGTYHAWGGVGSPPIVFKCTGGTDYAANSNPGTGKVEVIAPLCGFTFSPTNVDPGGPFTIQNIGGHTGDSFTAGLKNTPAYPSAPLPPNQTGTIPTSSLAFNVPAAATNGTTYQVFVTDTTYGNDCVIPGLASNILTVGTAGPTPTPTPGTGCNLASKPGANTSWGSDFAVPTVSSYTATFNLGSHPFNNYGILIEDNSTGQTPPNGNSPTLTSNSWTWTAPSTTAVYCAAVDYGGTPVSNVVTFSVPSTTGDTCSSSALNWANDLRCRAIGGGWFDSDVFTVGQSYATLETFNFMTWGKSPTNPRWATDTTKKTGALALTGNMVASLYSAPPASGVQYFAQKIHDLNPVTPAYAAAGGIGYQTLGPVQKIWIAFRNIAYVGFIIVFVIMGFMIMFRAHISPQAVATVQDSIPRLVIALILVTFSYAIAGFMIDLMFLFLNIIILALTATGLLTTGDFIFQHNVFGLLWGNTWKQVFSTVATAINGVIQGSLNLPGGILGDLAEKTIGWTGGTVAGLIVGIAILFIMFRVFLMLLMAYVMIILLTIFAPFFFLIQALPGNNGAKEWFRQMASNVAVFPVTALMFMLAGIIGGISALGGQGQGVVTPEQVGQFPLLTGGMNEIPRLIGIGFLLMTPSAADMVKNAMGGKGQGGPMGAFAPGAAAIGASAGFLGNRVSQSRIGRAYQDISEHRGRAGAARLAGFVVRDAPAPDVAAGNYGIARQKLPH